MSEQSAISWTEATWNPTTGCDRVSPGCANCYALAMAKRLKAAGNPRYQKDGGPASGPGFGLTVHPDLLGLPLRWRKPRLVFVNSMSDLFHEDVPDAFIAAIWKTMAQAPQHTFQVLTKRPDRMQRALTLSPRLRLAARDYWPLPNVHLGVSVENQRMADERIPVLLDTPAAVRFLSCEPLLGPLDLRPWLRPWPGYCQVCGGALKPPSATSCLACGSSDTDEGPPAPRRFERISWVICGGESGPGSAERKLVERCDFVDGDWESKHCPLCDATGWRPKLQALAWVRSIRDQCVAAGVPFHFKQWGATTPKAAGRLLDGRTWDETPA